MWTWTPHVVRLATSHMHLAANTKPSVGTHRIKGEAYLDTYMSPQRQRNGECPADSASGERSGSVTQLVFPDIAIAVW